MSTLIPRSIRYAHISLTFIGLMWVLPFLYWHHAYPLTTFFQETLAALLALLALPLLLSRDYWVAPAIPRIALLPVGLMLLIVLQYWLGSIPYFDQALLLMLYLLLAALLIMLGQRMRAELGLERVVPVLALALIIGSELNALAGVLQHYRWPTFLSPYVVIKTMRGVYGNIAQPNHFADYLTLGLISIGFLWQRGSLRGWQAMLLVVPLLFVLVLSGSRSSWLYQFAMLALGYLWQRRDAALRPLLHYSLALLAGFALMHGVVQLPWLAGPGDSVSTVERMFGEVHTVAIRFYLWHEAALIFAQYPLLGAGFGQFGWQHFLLTPQLAEPMISGLYNNAHNLVMQLAAETGLAGLAILLVTVGLWLRQAWRGGRDAAHWWAYAVLAVLAIHSLLEYPLWYQYFLGIAAFTLGLTERSSHALELRRLGRVSVAMILLLGALSLAQLHQSYRKLEAGLALRPQSAQDAAYPERVRDALLAVYDHALLRSYAELFLTSLIEPSPEHLADKLAMNGRALRFVPIATVAYRHAWLLALDGRTEEAQRQIERAIWSYPHNYAKAHAELQRLALSDPGHFAALLEFASRKFEEYQRGVPKP